MALDHRSLIRPGKQIRPNFFAFDKFTLQNLAKDVVLSTFIAPLRMHFLRSKSILDSLKSVFNVCRRKPSLGGCNVMENSHLLQFYLPYHSCFHQISGYSFTRLKRIHYFGMELQEKVEQV